MGILKKLIEEISGLKEENEARDSKIDTIAEGQFKVESALKEYTSAKRTGAPVQFMNKETVREAIHGFMGGLPVPCAKLEESSKKAINSLVASNQSLVESNMTIRPRKPLITIPIYEGNKFVWLALTCLVALVGTIIWATCKVNAIKNKAFYWADRAYQAAVIIDKDHPGLEYEETYNLFTEDAETAKKDVESFENEARRYQNWKQYLLSVIGEKDSRDIRILDWESINGEAWILYRFFDEDVERSVHVWPDGKAEETTDRIVKDLASARTYSKRKIWTVLRDARE